MTDKTDYSDWPKEDLVKEIKKLKKRKKYGIVWDEEKTKEKFDKESENKLPILKEVKRNEIKTNGTSPTNILIEGDNYHSLSVLNYTHAKRVDVISIDPPYNTGNDDFIFNDKYVDKEDTYSHSKWLSFMRKRLLLARDLLKKNGVFFSTIDDNEYSQLRLLCDEVFGEENFIATIIWQKVYSPKNQSKRISQDHEYILVFAKDIDQIDFNLLPRTEKMNARYKNPDNDSRGPWMSGDLTAFEERKNGHFEIEGPHGDKFDAPKGKHWSYSKSNMLQFQKEGRLWFGPNGKNFPRLRQYLSEVQQGKKPSTFFLHDEVGHSDEAKKELKNMFPTRNPDELFSTPKPTRLIEQLLRLVQSKNALVLDFTAGSGTTGHAVLSLNKKDGQNRCFILATNDENKICSETCYPRIKKVIEGYTNAKNEKVKGLGGNLKYFKTDFVDGEPTDKNKKKLVEQCTEMLCLGEDCFEEIKHTKNYSIFKNHEEKYLGIIYDDDGIEPLKKQIKSLGKKFNVYVFSLDISAREEEFEDVKGMVDLKPIPEVILNVYRRIFR